MLEERLPELRVPAGPVAPADLFSEPKDALWLEIGFGGGEHLAAQAAARPKTGFIGCEPFVNGVASLLVKLEGAGLANVRIFDEDVRQLLPELPGGSVERAFLLFPDPWPKRRHWGRRFIQPENLDALARVLKPGATFLFATDHMGYARWGLYHLIRHAAFEWTAETAADWRERPDGWQPTRYEEKALEGGDTCVYLTFRRSA